MNRDKPLVIFDGRCAFCRIWIDYWRDLTGDRVDYEPSQEVAGDFAQIPRAEFSKSVQLVMTDGEVLSGARAVYQLLTCLSQFGGLATGKSLRISRGF